MRVTRPDRDIIVAPELRMEEGLANDAIPVATAQLDVTSDSMVVSAVATLDPSNSFRNAPMAVASEIAPLPSASFEEEEEEDVARPDLLSATVFKESRSTKVGIAVKNTYGIVTVKSLDSEGLFSKAPFKLGDRVVSVNGKSCEDMNATSVADLIRDAVNIVTVVVRSPNGRADMVSSMCMRENPGVAVGVGVTRRRNKLVISRVAEDGVFAHSLLNVGDTCLSINEVKCTPDMEPITAATLIRCSPDFVTIVTKTEYETGVVVSKVSERGVSTQGSAPVISPTRIQDTAAVQRQDLTNE